LQCPAPVFLLEHDGFELSFVIHVVLPVRVVRSCARPPDCASGQRVRSHSCSHFRVVLSVALCISTSTSMNKTQHCCAWNTRQTLGKVFHQRKSVMLRAVAQILALGYVSAQLETLPAPTAFDAFRSSYGRDYATLEECVNTHDIVTMVYQFTHPCFSKLIAGQACARKFSRVIMPLSKITMRGTCRTSWR
jgi:hypothetical protein